MTDLEIIHELSEFYKHALNVSGNSKFMKNPEDINDDELCECNPPLWCGWMRCYFTPYLKNNKIIDTIHEDFITFKGEKFRSFKYRLLYSLQDYIDYISCFSYYNDETKERTLKLINNLNYINESNIIELIENNYNYFPTYDNAIDYESILEEKWNVQLIEIQLEKNQTFKNQN